MTYLYAIIKYGHETYATLLWNETKLLTSERKTLR